MDDRNRESQFKKGTQEIESLNIADFELLYKKLEDEDAELYSGGIFEDYEDNLTCPFDVYGGQDCPAAFTDCPALTRCDVNEHSCRNLTECTNNNFREDGCPHNMPCKSLQVCTGNYGLPSN